MARPKYDANSKALFGIPPRAFPTRGLAKMGIQPPAAWDRFALYAFRRGP